MIAVSAQKFPKSLNLRLVAGLVGSALFGLLLGTLLLAILATQFWGYKISTVQSYSMTPALERGDIIVTRPVAIENVEVGDIVLFRQGPVSVAHRVVNLVNQEMMVVNDTTGEVFEQNLRQLRTKGDANELADGNLVSAHELEGKLWFTVPGAGIVLHRFPIQAILLLAAAATGLAWWGYELLATRRRKAGEPQ